MSWNPLHIGDLQKITWQQNSKIPQWPQFDAQRRATPLFSGPTTLENDPRAEILKVWERMPPAAGPTG